MKQAQAKPQPPPIRRIIERPRLLNQLEETSARTILLVAPAGYGKTTLARQWLEKKGGAALAVGLAGSDVAVLARSLGWRLSEQVPGLPRAIEEAIRAAPTPARQAQSVARAILANVEDTLDRWVVIDDYHVLKHGSPAEILVETLEASGRFCLLIASRTRPVWATARRFLYGDILELNRAELSLNDVEAAELLLGRDDPKLLSREARGWPALVALAAIAGRPGAPPAGAGSATLYDFFAEEVYSQATEEARGSLLRLALLPALTRDSLRDVLGGNSTLGEALQTGVVYEEAGIIEMHPLARNFLYAKIAARPDIAPPVADGIDFALSCGYWDEAFDLITRFERVEYLDALITQSYLALVEAGRVATLETFGTYAARSGGLSQALLDLINAEIAYRDGLFERACSLGLAAASRIPDTHPLKARCYLVSGLAAQLDWKLEQAFSVFNQALSVSQRPRDTNDACWGRCLTAVFLEDDRLREALEEMGSLTHPTAEDRLRLLMGRQSVARLFDGLYDLRRDVAVANSLLPQISDPLVRTGWGNTCGYTLLLQGRYAQAKLVLTAALVDIDNHALAFGRPHIEWSLAAAELGLRQFARSDRLIRRVERYAAESSNAYLQLNTRALRARLLLAQRRITEAVTTTDLEFDGAPRDAMLGEYIGTRALALALAQRGDEALMLANDAANSTRAVEAQILAAAARAVALAETNSAASAAEDLLSIASRLGTWDGVVCACRASPALVNQLAKSSRRTQLTEALARSSDSALAHAAGLIDRRPHGRQGLLSRRETEVIDLLRQGLKTREIAAALYISDATVKVHVRHIFEKLGARTRAEAVARYADADTRETGAGLTTTALSSSRA